MPNMVLYFTISVPSRTLDYIFAKPLMLKYKQIVRINNNIIYYDNDRVS